LAYVKILGKQSNIPNAFDVWKSGENIHVQGETKIEAEVSSQILAIKG
jgi:hypothetical protein